MTNDSYHFPQVIPLLLALVTAVIRERNFVESDVAECRTGSHKSYVLHEGRMHLPIFSVYIEFELAKLPCTVQT